ncbi:MAG: hypothetical protein NXH75_08535 [Halobacteriovoraceae bacterium]|nr:hypothetical protein [Halobacteriovoraceae bacterium]
MKKTELSLFFVALFFTGCATSTKVLESDFQKVSMTKEGVLLTVNLQTNGRVRDDKSCYLNIDAGKNHFQLLIKRGVGDYALPLQSGEGDVEITKISCGPFYYYDLKNQGATFQVKREKVKYLGFIDFELEDKGKLEWGHSTMNENHLRQRAQRMGLNDDSLEIDLLKL